MDYLTNYYKNLCEQLQEKLNILEAQVKSAANLPSQEGMKKSNEEMSKFQKNRESKEREARIKQTSKDKSVGDKAEKEHMMKQEKSNK